MRLSDLGGAGNDEINMRPLAHAFAPKGNRLHTVNAVARGFLRSGSLIARLTHSSGAARFCAVALERRVRGQFWSDDEG